MAREIGPYGMGGGHGPCSSMLFSLWRAPVCHLELGRLIILPRGIRSATWNIIGVRVVLPSEVGECISACRNVMT